LNFETWIIEKVPELAILAYILVSWWRSRNDASKARASELATLSNALNAALGNVTTLSKRLDEMEAVRVVERHTHETERVDFECRIDALTADLRRTKEDAEKSTTMLTNEVVALKGQLATEKRERQQEVTKREQLERDVAALRSEREQLKGERAVLIANQEALTLERDEMKKRMVMLEEKNQKLSERLDRMALGLPDTGPLGEAKTKTEAGESPERKSDNEERTEDK
jgi:chromosome segregation ATPase